jgi:hypothetical protein
MNVMSDVNDAAFEAERERERERELEREHQSAAAAREWKRSQEFAATVMEQEAAAKRKEEEAAARERQARDLEAKRREHEAAKVQEIEIATHSEAKFRLPTGTDVLRAHAIPSAHSGTQFTGTQVQTLATCFTCTKSTNTDTCCPLACPCHPLVTLWNSVYLLCR